MELEVADQEQGNGGAAGAGGQQQGGDGGAGGPDLGRFVEEFGAFRTDLTSRFDALEQRVGGGQQQGGQEQSGAGEDGDDGFDMEAIREVLAELGDDAFEDDGELTPEAQHAAMQAMIRAEAERIVDARLAPRDAQAAAERREAELDALEQKYPELGEEGDDAVVQQVIEEATAAAKRLGNEKLVEEPAFLEMAYLSVKARARAEQQQGGDEGEVHLETGASTAARRQQEQDPGDSIVAAAHKGNFRLGR